MPHCDSRVRWKVASDLRFRAATSEPETLSFCGISGDLAPSTRKSLAIAIVRFWCAKRIKEGRGMVSQAVCAGRSRLPPDGSPKWREGFKAPSFCLSGNISSPMSWGLRSQQETKCDFHA